jgi:RNA polymerase sigma-70 factor (ECF subfamily)
MNPRAAARHTSVSDLLVAEARAGSEVAFGRLVGEHRRELRVHCYRMLGSFEDAEDAVQETLIRAWSRISTYAGTSTFRAWLYAIATNVCLDALRRRRARGWPTTAGASAPDVPLGPSGDLPWVGPYPDARLPGIAESAEDAVVRKEHIELAFLVAIQQLPPRQRAVLILRDVLAWSAKETAAALGITSVAANSALQRARATMAAETAEARSEVAESDQRESVAAFMSAWERSDLDALAELLAEDARFVMPPLPMWFDGREDVLAFLARRFRDHGAAQWRLVPTAANCQPAVGIYLRPEGQVTFEPFAIAVLRVGDDGIDDITLFMRDPALFDLFELSEAG